jgi:hypothetical protein
VREQNQVPTDTHYWNREILLSFTLDFTLNTVVWQSGQM